MASRAVLHLELVHDVMVDGQLALHDILQVLLDLQEAGLEAMNAVHHAGHLCGQRTHSAVLHISEQVLYTCSRETDGVSVHTKIMGAVRVQASLVMCRNQWNTSACNQGHCRGMQVS